MKKSGNGKLRGKGSLNGVLSGLLLLALMVSLPVFARAESDTDGDAKIQAMRSDIMACMQPGAAGQKAREAFAKKYDVPLSKINENIPGRPPASNGGWDYNTAFFFCGMEYLTAALAVVWATRAAMDKYKSDNMIRYCTDYSMNCDHFNWRQYCLKEKVPTCCK